MGTSPLDNNHKNVYSNYSNSNPLSNAILDDGTTVYNHENVCEYIDTKKLCKLHIENNPNLSLIHFNSRSLFKNHDAISEFLCTSYCDFTISAVTETWLHQDIPSSLIDIPGYNFIRNDRPNKRGGGVGIYIKEGISYKIHTELNKFSENFETLFIDANFEGENYLIGVLYRPPDNPVKPFIDDLSNLLDHVSTYSKCYLLGDFNIDFLKYMLLCLYFLRIILKF